MGMVSIPVNELKAMDKKIGDQAQLIRDQQEIIKKLMELLKQYFPTPC